MTVDERSKRKRRGWPWRNSSDVLWMPTWRRIMPHMPHSPSPKEGTPIHPPLKKTGAFWAAFCNIVEIVDEII
jgi:hypothetical protein